MVQYSLFMLKVPLNSNQPTNLCTCVPVPVPVYLYLYLCTCTYLYLCTCTCTCVLQYTHVPRLIPVITSNLTSKSSVIRK